ncbi:hypothetical protein CpB0980 [Chlamydia pneumoniae TW-183]|uniref:Uncharacterized protein n=2 Tax=Chlamydia pneumoniae TaxID=83558 RepID=Q9Z6W1_CHLPN|nr:hypothetical protein [Chlamydia pneumoniae]AAD19083.1 CT795 hypothetical protein [Chlamydia pneumoniae CWL029]AAF38699.1 conserved hypothetical protein [Chlamydia pneumoniae AR39]AAP98909.1 hypothetical protein CpB0980 [Chlamydia pneumoniae TW-183]ACZ32836.1 conserved hypothetical protein [Chlamydia pneumoniae LPCoLN]ETR79721.1 hypothetical protein X556_0956 [Chlamydia pneumoniae B21]
MRIALSLLSLLMIFPIFGEESRPGSEDGNSNTQEIVGSQDTQVCLYHSYEQGLQASRIEGKPLVIVVLCNSGDDGQACTIGLSETCEEVLSVLSGSIFSELANFVVLVPSGVNPLIYPPIEDPILAEIVKFKELFKDESFPTGLSIIVVGVTPEGPGDIIEVSPVSLTVEEEETLPSEQTTEVESTSELQSEDPAIA